MGGNASRPTIVRQRRYTSIRSRRGRSLISLLLEGKYVEALGKVRVEASKEVCVKFDDDQERWVLPLHVACALPDAPLSIIQSLVQAYPQALTHHTTLAKAKTYKGDEDLTSTFSAQREREHSLGSGSSSVISTESRTSGVGWLPLHVAAHYGAPLATMEFLLQESAGSIYCKSTEGYLPLHVACVAIESSHHLIEALVNAFPLSIYVPTSNGVTAHELAELEAKGRYPTALILLDPAPSSVTHSERQSRPTHNIPCANRRSVFKKIVLTGRLENKVNRETKLFKALSKSQWSDALEFLSRKPKEALIWTLSSDPNDPPCHLLPLHIALRRNAPRKVVQALLNANTSAIYRREFFSMLPLHVACDLGMDIAVIKLLCEAFPGAARQPDLGGMLPLHLACASTASCSSVTITYLLSINADAMHVKDSKGCLAQEYLGADTEDLAKEFDRTDDFWAAKEISKNNLAKLICQKQWDAALERLNEVPEEAAVWTIHPLIHLRYLPLHYACIVQAPIDLVKALVDVHPLAASAECQEYDMLPLHLACQHGAHPSVVEALLSTHTDAAAAPDAFDLLPLHLACTQGASVVVIEALVEAFPDAVDAVDRNGHTPKVYAKAGVHPHTKKIAQVLETGRCT